MTVSKPAAIMDMDPSVWQAEMGLSDCELPVAIVSEGSWWRAERTAWRLGRLEDTRELTFPDIFFGRWQGRLVNIHPSLLPAFPGLDTHARALAAGVKLHGCSVHLVSAEVDQGPIIGQAAVPVLPEDDEATLAARVLEAEHRLFPLCLGLLAEGRVSVEDGRAVIQGAPDAGGLIMNPDQRRPG